MSITEVSILSGEILLALERGGGKLPAEALADSRSCSRDLLLMALGCLYKEGLIVLRPGIGGWMVQAASGSRA